MDIESILARYILNTEFDDLTPEAKSVTKDHLLHTIGTVLGGSSAPGCNLVVDLVRDWGGAAQSSVLVYGRKVPSPNAVLANSTMAHALDFCDNDDRTAYKSSVCVVPVCLAVAEAEGNITGEELITAMCLGIDLGIRLGLSTGPQYAHEVAGRLGVFASAAAAGRLMGLEEGEMLNAFGLAYSQIASRGAGGGPITMTKRLGPGFAAKSGIISSLLAKKGYTSDHHVFSGPSGYFKFYHGKEGDLSTLVADLGKKFEITQVGPKPYPCCRCTHPPIDATLQLVVENGIASQDVKEVKVYLSSRSYIDHGVGNNPGDLEVKRRPRGVVDAQFSVPWTVAAAIVKRDVFIPAFTESSIHDPEMLAMAQKVIPVLLPELDKGQRFIKGAIVEIITLSGKVYSKRVDFPLGSPEYPVSPELLRRNFRRASAFAAKPFTEAQVENIIETVNELEKLQDTRDLASLLTPFPN